MEYPEWHFRFVNARNLLADACATMNEACFFDKNNEQFKRLFDKMAGILHKMDVQGAKNFKRGKKEGWIK